MIKRLLIVIVCLVIIVLVPYYFDITVIEIQFPGFSNSEGLVFKWLVGVAMILLLFAVGLLVWILSLGVLKVIDYVKYG
jgi:hypothetical protein